MSQQELHDDPKNASGDSDIGRAVAWAFAREGATIVISYLNEHEDTKEIQQAISKIGRECIVVISQILTG
ncbi:unnamed protein product [Rotaria sp. Silwood1]|nr:unnamed protein product [Rotaria sp. Silwood1]CAF1629650.1 unnamed protein product [Rotaria sp. Silwood1]